MKRTIALLIVFLLCFGCVSCGGNASVTTPAVTDPSTVPATDAATDPVTEPVTEEPVEEDVSLDELENEEETSVEDLFGAVNGTLVEPAAPVKEEPKIMDNTEQLHKVDQKSESSRQEFKSILDFFAANGLT